MLANYRGIVEGGQCNDTRYGRQGKVNRTTTPMYGVMIQDMEV